MLEVLITTLPQLAILVAGAAFGLAGLGLLHRLRERREAEEWDPY